MKTKVFLSLALLLLAEGCRQQTSHEGALNARCEATAQALEESARRTRSLEAFGQAIVQQILSDAAEQIRGGNLGPMTVDLSFDVSITEIPTPSPPPLPPREPPDLENLDLCALICSGEATCYFQCVFAGESLTPVPLFRDCNDIWQDYWACGNNLFCKWRYIQELISKGCLEIKKVHLEALPR